MPVCDKFLTAFDVETKTRAIIILSSAIFRYCIVPKIEQFLFFVMKMNRWYFESES